jgi:hypothetical protein
MVEKFKSRLFKKMHRTDFMTKFITTFIRCNPSKNMNLDEIKEYLHNYVNDTSLCEQETIFFNELINCDAQPEKYIDTLKSIYYKINGLENCQLGNCIIKCIDAGKDISFSYYYN